MTITVSCPSCNTTFPVDPAKVPVEGVRAQCSVCPEIFDVDRPSADTLGASQAPASTTYSPETTAAPDLTPSVTEDFGALDLDVGPPTAEFVAPVETAPPAGAAPYVPPVAAPPPAPPVAATPNAAPAQEAPATPGPESAKPIRFGRRSPEDKAKSLARSLISDLIAYNPEKHKGALASGTLREVFADEIDKSLRDYQEQVEPDVMAKGTFFNDALNSILAEGQSVFSLDD